LIQLSTIYILIDRAREERGERREERGERRGGMNKINMLLY
jgi:hypothetical protein